MESSVTLRARQDACVHWGRPFDGWSQAPPEHQKEEIGGQEVKEASKGCETRGSLFKWSSSPPSIPNRGPAAQWGWARPCSPFSRPGYSAYERQRRPLGCPQELLDGIHERGPMGNPLFVQKTRLHRSLKLHLDFSNQVASEDSSKQQQNEQTKR